MPAASLPMDGVMHVVVFTLGGERYALPIARVQEVIRHSHPRPVGSRIPFVAGVIELRGRIVPVCDIAARVGARAGRTDQQKIVIVDLAGGQAGVLVDAVDEVVVVPERRLAPAPAEIRTAWLSNIARLGDELVMVLDPEELLEGVIDAAPEPVVEVAAVEPVAEAKPKRKPAARKPAAKTAARKPAAKTAARKPAPKTAARKAAAPAA
jgi:purine-binding chemotaxis protein CheW